MNLIVFFNNNSNIIIHSVKEGQDIDSLLKLASQTANQTPAEIIGHKFIETSELKELYRPALIFKNSRIYTDRKRIIEDKLASIREIRNNILKEIDIPRKVAEETGDKEKYNLLTDKVKKLRDITKNINWNKLKTDREILEYNPFKDIA